MMNLDHAATFTIERSFSAFLRVWRSKSNTVILAVLSPGSSTAFRETVKTKKRPPEKLGMHFPIYTLFISRALRGLILSMKASGIGNRTTRQPGSTQLRNPWAPEKWSPSYLLANHMARFGWSSDMANVDRQYWQSIAEASRIHPEIDLLFKTQRLKFRS